MNNNRIFFDFEFIEQGSAFVMEPISLGMVNSEGRNLYLEFSDVDWSKANPWVLENVKPYLWGPDRAVTVTREEAKDYILAFAGEKPEFWAYFADYDWVLLCQLFGRMVDLPESWPMWCRDLKQLMWHCNLHKEDIPVENGGAHNALMDAIWNREVYSWIGANANPNEVDLVVF